MRSGGELLLYGAAVPNVPDGNVGPTPALTRALSGPLDVSSALPKQPYRRRRKCTLAARACPRCCDRSFVCGVPSSVGVVPIALCFRCAGSGKHTACPPGARRGGFRGTLHVVAKPYAALVF